MSNPMVPPFQILGPSKQPYPGTVCLPQVPLPVNASVNVGDNATIQLVELAVHGAALYSVRSATALHYYHQGWKPASPRLKRLTRRLRCMQCVDITFVEPGDPRIPEVNETNCFNSTDIGFADLYTITTKPIGQGNGTISAAVRALALDGWALTWLGYLPLLLGGLLALL
jgi:hypothetical protein